MTEPTWREIRELTRLRRRQAATIRAGSVADALATRRKYAKRIEKGYYHPHSHITGLIPNSMIRDLWTFQNGHCYMCAALFHRDRYVTKEHVVPRALGGTNDANILLACIPCNNTKADRPPTRRELAMLAAWLHNDRNAWYRLMMTLDPDIPPG